eukprot:jgi/Mesvir1/27735/Mv07430-RA.1
MAVCPMLATASPNSTEAIKKKDLRVKSGPENDSDDESNHPESDPEEPDQGAIAAAGEDSEPDDDEFPDENVIDPDEELWARLYKLGNGQEPAPMDLPAWGVEQTTIREDLMAGHTTTYPPRLVGFCCPDPADASNWDWFKHFFPTDLLPEMADLMTERGLARGYKDWKLTVGAQAPGRITAFERSVRHIEQGLPQAVQFREDFYGRRGANLKDVITPLAAQYEGLRALIAAFYVQLANGRHSAADASDVITFLADFSSSIRGFRDQILEFVHQAEPGRDIYADNARLLMLLQTPWSDRRMILVTLVAFLQALHCRFPRSWDCAVINTLPLSVTLREPRSRVYPHHQEHPVIIELGAAGELPEGHDDPAHPWAYTNFLL